MKNECLRLLGIGKNSRKVSKKESSDEAIRDGLIDEMLYVQSDMHSLAKAMDHFADVDESMKERARQLMAASDILEQWASEFEENSKSNEDVINKKLSAAAKVGFSPL